MNATTGKPGRWFCAIPLVYRDKWSFWVRDGGLVCLGLRTLGMDAKFVALGQPGTREDVPLITCTLEHMMDAAWWKQWGLEGVILCSWALPRYEPIARAVKTAGCKLILTYDVANIASPYVWPRMYLREKYHLDRDEGHRFSAIRAVLKTMLHSVPRYHAGTLAHLSHADRIVVSSPLALQRYRRHLLALKRADLAGRVRTVPYPVVKEMSHDPGIPKKPMLVAAARWESFFKNAPLLMRVLGRVLAEQPEYTAKIAGSGAETLRALAGKLDASCRSRIEIIGWLDHEKVPALYRESQIFLCTSYSESFMIAAGEALSCGCSVVGDARISSMVYFTGLGSGTVSCDGSADNFGDAVRAEIAAWKSGARDPAQISAAWRDRLHADRVAAAFLKIIGEPVPKS
jgi:glycosyltransferase involved in cell wall biosynthesis